MCLLCRRGSMRRIRVARICRGSLRGASIVFFWVCVALYLILFRYVLRQKNAVLEPLYHLEEVESITVFEKGVGH